MAHSHPQPDPAALQQLAEARKHGWKEFTRATVIASVGVALLLFVMWLVFMVILKPAA